MNAIYEKPEHFGITMSTHTENGTVVLLRGLLREQGHWGDFTQRLQQALPGMSIITLDALGNGQCYQELSPISIADTVANLRSQLHEQNYTAPLHLVGLSMGGMMVMHWLQNFPYDVASATLINSSFRGLSPFYQRLQKSNYSQILRALWQSIDDREALILQLTANSQAARQQALPSWQRIARQHPVRRRNALRQIIAAARFKPLLKPLTAPLFVIASQHDRIVDVRCSEAISHYWKTPIATHPSAGHDLPLDAPDWLVEQLHSWLKVSTSHSSVDARR